MEDIERDTACGAHNYNPAGTEVGLATPRSRDFCEGEVELNAGAGQCGQ